MFFRHTRFHAKRLFFDQLGCILCENTTPSVDINKCFPRDVITEIELTHPLVGSTAAEDDDQMNKKLVSKADNSWREFHFIVQYRINVKDGEKNESKVVRMSISVFMCALSFCVAFSQCANTETFLRSSTYVLRMAYTVAVSFSSFLVEIRDLSSIFQHTPSSINREDFIMRWSFLMPDSDSLKNLQHECLASIDYSKYNEFCAGAEDGSDESSSSKIDDEDSNDV
jgi:hypothetical protein